MLLWLSVVFASLSWIFAVHLYVTEDRYAQWALIAAAFAAAAAGLRRGARLSRGHLALLVPLVLAAFLAVPPYRAPLLLLGAGVVLSAAAASWDVTRRAGGALLLVGAVLLVQTPVYWLVTAWTARNPEVPYAATALYGLLKWVGADVSLCGHSLYVRTMGDVHRFPVTWGHLALFPTACLWLGGCAAIWWDRGRRRVLERLTLFTAVAIAYAVIRLFLVLACFITAMLYEPYGSETVHVELFWLPWITALSFVPIVPFLAWIVPWPDPGETEEDAAGRPLLGIVAAAVACAACLGLAAAVRFPDPGDAKPGRLLIDEAHSRWERTDTAYDTEWYGSESGYNYYCMAQYLRHFFDVGTNLEGELTPEKLAACDVLLLKNPTTPFSEAELDAIDGFVRAGGGLFLMGEHTDVFGTSTCLNAVARKFGLEFRPDAVFDIERKWEQVYFPPRVGAHPIVGDVPFFRFAVTCSVETTTWDARPVMRGTGLWTLPIEYAASNFYPKVEDHTYAGFGAFDQMVAVKAGRGRVVAFSDSTVYSNFLAFRPGKPEVLVNTVEWLNRSNRDEWIRTLGCAVFAGGLALVALLSALRRHRTGATLMLLAAAALGAWGGLWACTLAGRAFYPAPQPRTPVPVIAFDMAHSGCELPVFGFPQKHGESYDVFYQWVLRPGFFPKVTFDPAREMAAGAPLVVVKAAGPLPPVREYLEKGGRLLVLESPGSDASASNELLAEFGISFAEGRCAGASLEEPASGVRICGAGPARAVRGGTALLATEAGETVLACVPVGEGAVIAAGLADRFVDTAMGGSSRRIPDGELRAVYELAFTLMRCLVEGDPPGLFAALAKTYAR